MKFTLLLSTLSITVLSAPTPWLQQSNSKYKNVGGSIAGIKISSSDKSKLISKIKNSGNGKVNKEKYESSAKGGWGNSGKGFW